ncbi:MAG: nucleotidyltransferase domain-containing protein [Candidatus Methanoperedens sp.]|nr:nucleotidyltransferase domain-containing protein [Candidatus Methanoperedens sp.]
MGGNDAVDEIEKFVKRIKEVIRVEKVIIFGSRARGDYLADSDVDLIIVSRDFEGVPFYERMDKLILLWESPLDLEALCYTPEEFKMKQEEICIVKEAVEEGMVIAG